MTELIKSGKDISTAGGNIKEFVYVMAASIFTALSKDRNIHAIKGVTRRLIPQTGFGTHARGVEIMNTVDKGDFRGAIEKMAAHRMSFEVNGLWGLQDQGPIGEVYKQCRKSLPHVDMIVMRD